MCLLFSPFVLTANLVLLLRREVILDVEGLTNLVRRLAFDHVGDRLASNIQKCLDIEIIGRLDKEHRQLL